MVNNAKIKKWLQSKDEIKGTDSRMQSQGETQGRIIKSSVKTTERSKFVPKSSI